MSAPKLIGSMTIRVLVAGDGESVYVKDDSRPGERWVPNTYYTHRCLYQPDRKKAAAAVLELYLGSVRWYID